MLEPEGRKEVWGKRHEVIGRIAGNKGRIHTHTYICIYVRKKDCRGNRDV